MYPASPVSPVMPDTQPERVGIGRPCVDDSERKKFDIKQMRSPSSTTNKSPLSAAIDTKNEYQNRSPTSLSPLKRKQSPENSSDSETGKRSKIVRLFGNSFNKMDLDINDIGMPGRSGSTRSRTKVPAQERRRVPVACDSCRHRKIKCNGESPCQNCSKNSYDCHFPPVSAKIVVEEHWVERLQGRCNALERALIEAIPDPEKREQLAAHYGLRLMIAGSPSEQSESDLGSGTGSNFNMTSERDQSGGYETEAGYSFIGDSASLTFVNKIREYVRATVPVQAHMNNLLDPIHAFLASGADSDCRSAPLSLPSTDPYILPHKPTVISLIQRFISFLGCGSTPETSAPSGGVYYWFDTEKLSKDLELLFTSVNIGMLNIAEQSKPIDYTVLCMVNAVLALACQSTTSTGVGPLNVEEEAIAGDAYFWTSFVPRRTNSGDRSLTPDQAFTPTSPHSALSDYGENQANYFTMTDYNTSSATSMPNGSSQFQPGMTFFARAKALMVSPSDAPSLSTLRTLSMLAYFLLSANRWEAAYLHIGLAVRLAVANGLHRRRFSDSPGMSGADPRMKQREEEDKRRTFWTIYILDRLVSCITGRPVMLCDDAIDTELPTNIEGLPSASGLCAHVQLSRIMGEIITNVYPIRRPGDTIQTQHQLIMQAIQKAHCDLTDWHENLPSELKLVNGVARERGVLWLHSLYNELLMLICRPNLLLAMKRTAATIHSPNQTLPALSQQVYDHTTLCATAAGSNLLLARQIQASGWVHASFLECSYVFNAGMTLVLARLLAQGGPEWSGRQNEEDIQYAIAFLSTLGKGGNLFARKYTKDLMDLDGAVTRLIEARNLNVSLQALGGSPTAMTLPPVTVAPGLVPTLYPSDLQDFPLFETTDYRELLNQTWNN